MAAWTAAAARQAANIARLSTPKSLATSARASILVQRRGLASGGDHHGPPKVNVWEDPMSPSKWKEEHIMQVLKVETGSQWEGNETFVIVSLTGWGLLIYGGYKIFSGGKKDKEEEKVGEGAH